MIWMGNFKHKQTTTFFCRKGEGWDRKDSDFIVAIQRDTKGIFGNKHFLKCNSRRQPFCREGTVPTKWKF